MNEPKLARMANQVAAFFRSYPEEEAVAGIRAHLRAYWTRGMIRDLAARAVDPATDLAIAAADAPLLDPLVARALTERADADNPARKAQAGPQSAGLLVSDAG